MKLTENIITTISQSSGKALATNGPDGVHVVPVSKIKVVGEKIWLVNYFMGKTIKNITADSHVALACWQGLEGYQVKGTVEYITQGEIFEQMVVEAATEFPDRTVKGVLIITPDEVFDVSATATRPGEKIL